MKEVRFRGEWRTYGFDEQVLICCKGAYKVGPWGYIMRPVTDGPLIRSGIINSAMLVIFEVFLRLCMPWKGLEMLYFMPFWGYFRAFEHQATKYFLCDSFTSSACQQDCINTLCLIRDGRGRFRPTCENLPLNLVSWSIPFEIGVSFSRSQWWFRRLCGGRPLESHSLYRKVHMERFMW